MGRACMLFPLTHSRNLSQTLTLELQGSCTGQGGTELEMAACEPSQEPICCRYLDGTFGLATTKR